LFDTSSEKINSLQAGRAVAALSVVAHHASMSTADFVGILPHAIGNVLGFGWLGVDFFFVLSGFIIYHTTLTKAAGVQGAKSYAKSRITRIFVPFLPISIALMLLYTLLPSLSASSRDWSVLASLSLLPVGSPALTVAWTLQHEVVFYAIFALGFFTGRLWLVLGMWAAAIVACALLGLHPAVRPVSILLSLINLEFLFGIGCAILSFRRHRHDGWLYPAVAVASFAVWGMLGFERVLSPIAGLGIAAIIVPVVRLELVGRLRVPGWAVFLGAASYAIYLIHNPLLSIAARVAARLPVLSNVYVATLFGVFATIIAGCLYHLWLEKPASTWVRERLAAGHQVGSTIRTTSGTSPRITFSTLSRRHSPNGG
jgi:exopolysaccharide production protein ExoZ